MDNIKATFNPLRSSDSFGSFEIVALICVAPT